jgi:hypothetical protein
MLFTALASIAIAAPRAGEAIVSRMPRSAVGSSALATIGYSKRLRALEVEFHNGAIYRYLNVPPGVYQALMAAPSKAAYYDANIRGRYRSVHIRRRP